MRDACTRHGGAEIDTQGDAFFIAFADAREAHELGNASTVIHGLGLLAMLAAGAGERARAGRLWGAVEALEEGGEAKLDPGSRTRYEGAVLGLWDAELEAGRAKGRAMTLGEAVEHALGSGT